MFSEEDEGEGEAEAIEIVERETRRVCSNSEEVWESSREKRGEGREERIGIAARSVSPVCAKLSLQSAVAIRESVDRWTYGKRLDPLRNTFCGKRSYRNLVRQRNISLMKGYL